MRDDGPGIPAELRPRLFQRFSRADTARNRAGGSTGLGLAIAEAIVHAHGGTIAVGSGSGGTTFTIRLPALTGDAHPAHWSRRGRPVTLDS